MGELTNSKSIMELMKVNHDADLIKPIPKGFIAHPIVRQRLYEQLASKKDFDFTDDLRAHKERFFGLDIIACPGMPDSEILSFQSPKDASRFVEACGMIGYEHAKKLFKIGESNETK